MHNEDRIREIIREEIAFFMKPERYVMDRTFQLLDGRNIQLGTDTGTQIGTESTQKIGFYGTDPVVQGSFVSSPSVASVSGTGDDATINSNFTNIKTAVDNVRTRLSDIGITS